MLTDTDEFALSEGATPEKIDELQTLKKEYEEFTYIISHDLAAPFRHIQQFSTLLLQSIEEPLDERQERFAFHITKSVDRCQKMLDGLLQLSRINTAEIDEERVSINSVIQRSVELQLHDITECDVLLTLNPLPKILANKSQLECVVYNLIDNAVKFRKKNSPLRIKISTEHQENSVLLCIEDNGIGIEEKSSESIFDVFKTLNPTGDYSGIGIGLALCRKILTRHGAKIWTEIAAEGGTAFYVLLPVD